MASTQVVLDWLSGGAYDPEGESDTKLDEYAQ